MSWQSETLVVCDVGTLHECHYSSWLCAHVAQWSMGCWSPSGAGARRCLFPSLAPPSREGAGGSSGFIDAGAHAFRVTGRSTNHFATTLRFSVSGLFRWLKRWVRDPLDFARTKLQSFCCRPCRPLPLLRWGGGGREEGRGGGSPLQDHSPPAQEGMGGGLELATLGLAAPRSSQLS